MIRSRKRLVSIAFGTALQGACANPQKAELKLDPARAVEDDAKTAPTLTPPGEAYLSLSIPVSAGADPATSSAELSALEQTIYFAFDEASLREDSKPVLAKVAESMKKQPGLKIEIEGHSDARGSTEYNLQLGERRAHAVEKYLSTQGVSSDRIDIISYGAERLADAVQTEEAHQHNRRAEIKKRLALP